MRKPVINQMILEGYSPEDAANLVARIFTPPNRQAQNPATSDAPLFTSESVREAHAKAIQEL